jgi:acetyl-CoA C-acetyltransferase
MQEDPIVIAGYARTPMGGFQGALSPLKATDLGAAAVRAAIERAKLPADAVDRIYMGCVLPAGLGQAPARQAALGAGLGLNTEATTVNKMCGSGMQAAIMAHEALAAGAADIIVAGGMESMTNAPYALPKHRAGARIGHDRIIDTMMMDGLEDAYEPGKAKPDKIPSLRPAFAKDGTITAANASSISDGAAALVMTRRSVADRLGLPVVAQVVATAAHAHEPSKFTTAPVPAMRKLLDKAGWSVDDVDLFEVNEAFAVVAMIAERELSIPAEKLNVNGGATALGHPIGASGARILTTLIAALENRGLRRGVASLCIGGGEATAMAVELI